MGIIRHPYLAVDQWSFEFSTRTVKAVSSAGVPYTREVWTGMPRIPSPILNSVFYLYHSRADAEAGEPVGGTGFFFGFPFGGPNRHYVYAVTNWHVAVQDGASVIRVNKRGGGIDVIELGPEDWHFIPGGPDLAIADAVFDQSVHNLTFLHSNMIATQDSVAAAGIGAGEDIFMVGRFADHDGADGNIPAVRFGHISVMPQNIPQPTGSSSRPSYILDVHSRSGFSGSPVFAYRTPGTDMETPTGLMQAQLPYSRFIILLGVHWGQFPEKWEISSHTEPNAQSALPANAKYVQGFSGMTLAIPADTIFEVLNMPKLKNVRDAIIAKEEAKLLPIAESAQDEQGSNSQHKEAFTSLLNAAVRTTPQAD